MRNSMSCSASTRAAANALPSWWAGSPRLARPSSRAAVSATRDLDEAVRGYASFMWDHLGREEGVILPAARRYLTEDDWSAIDAAFMENRASGRDGRCRQRSAAAVLPDGRRGSERFLGARHDQPLTAPSRRRRRLGCPTASSHRPLLQAGGLTVRRFPESAAIASSRKAVSELAGASARSSSRGRHSNRGETG